MSNRAYDSEPHTSCDLNTGQLRRLRRPLFHYFAISIGAAIAIAGFSAKALADGCIGNTACESSSILCCPESNGGCQILNQTGGLVCCGDEVCGGSQFCAMPATGVFGSGGPPYCCFSNKYSDGKQCLTCTADMPTCGQTCCTDGTMCMDPSKSQCGPLTPTATITLTPTLTPTLTATATITPTPSPKTQAQKDEWNRLAKVLDNNAAKLGLGVEVYCAGAIVLPPLRAACAEFKIYIAAMKAKAADLRQMAIDPPDPNYKQVATVVVPLTTPIAAQGGMTSNLANALNAILWNDENTIGLEEALLTTFNRYCGAVVANDSYWEDQQLQAANSFENQIGVLLTNEVELLPNLENTLKANGFPSVTDSPSDIANFQAQVASSGLPDSIIQAFNQLGVDQATITEFAQDIIALDPNTATSTFPDMLADPQLLTDIQTAALVTSSSVLPVYIEIKPQATPPVPINGGSSGTTPVAILSTAAFDATTVTPQSVQLDGGAATKCNVQDVNGDGVDDLVCHITTSRMIIPGGISEVTLTGQTASGTLIQGAEEIQSVP